VGREVETRTIGRLIADARTGVSGVLVLEGEAGIGKTALLVHAESLGAGTQTSWAAGVLPEADVPYSGLHQLLVPFLDGLDRIPGPHADALRVAFGLTEAPPRDRFFVGMAALALLSDAAMRTPVLCLIDDAHHLDSASLDALGFTARRLVADRVVMLFAVRDRDGPIAALQGLAHAKVACLEDVAGLELVAVLAGREADNSVARRIVTDTGGHPLAIIEAVRGLSRDQLHGLAPLPEVLPLVGELEDLFVTRLRALPSETQTVLLLAAADPSGELGLVLQAAEQEYGFAPESTQPPRVESFISWSPRIRFQHPLLRSAAYYRASEPERRRAHRALAAACDPVRDADHRAWHLAVAAVEADEEVARELEQASDRARRRGGWAQAARFLERAAELTPDASQRAERTLACAHTRLLAGQPSAARSALNVARGDLIDPLLRCDAVRLEGKIDFTLGRPNAVASLLSAARMYVDHDAREARDTLLPAFDAVQIAGSFSRVELGEVLDAARTIGIDEALRTPGDDLLDGYATLVESGDSAGVPMLRRALDRLTADRPVTDDELTWLPLAWNTALELYDDRTWQMLTARWTMATRMHGSVAALSFGLGRLAHFDVVTGRYPAAQLAAAEARDIARAGQIMARPDAIASLSTLAWRGAEAEARTAAAELIPEMTSLGRGIGIRLVQLAITVLELGLGNYREALRAGSKAWPQGDLSQLNATPELVEAAVRCGELDVARAVLKAVRARAEASGTDWAIGLMLRSEALLVDPDQAEDLYRGAIEHLDRTLVIPQLGRAHLLYGEWLRRQRRRRDARDELRIAYEILADLGANAFAERARAELLATGEHTRRRVAETLDQLTPQEEQVARLASDGASNMEIATQLFISVPTVVYHLQKAFRKLDVTNRTRLARAFNERGDRPAERSNSASGS
jgi:DNA-binding CsgD family transcriptional regulator